MSYTDGHNRAELRSEKDAAQKFTPVEVWLKKIEQAKTDKKREAWMRDARNALSMYEAGEVTSSDESLDQLSGANLWHSNIETVTPALFNSVPVPYARTRFGDPDPVQKEVCTLYERLIAFDLDTYDYADRIKEIVKQSENTGWGIPRIRYKPQVQTIQQDPAQDGDTTPNSYEQIIKDDVYVECHPWDRFIPLPARSPDKITAMAFEHDLTLDEIDDLAPPTIDPETGESVPASARFSPDHSSSQDDSARQDSDPAPDNPGIINTMTVYEVWDKRTRKVWFITPKDKKNPIVVKDDPLELDDFFPVPKILYAKRRISSIQPISPWTVYKGLFQEFEDVTKRINGLVGQIRARGLYAKELEADFELLRTCKDGEYVPAKDVSQFTSGGGKGLEAAVLHWPLQMLVAALKECVDQRERVKQLIFETTGLSDILRGATNPNETLGAQKIKASWGSQRIQDAQEDVADLNRAIIRMKAEIRARYTPWELIKEITGLKYEPKQEDIDAALQDLMAQWQQSQQPQMGGNGGPPMVDPMMQQQMQGQALQMATEKAQQFEAAVEKAFRERSRVFRIDIETDSTVRADLARDQEQIGNFVQFTGSYMQGAVAAIQLMPETRQPLFKIYVATASKYKLGRQAEQAFNELIDAALKPIAQQGGQDPQAAAQQQQMQQAEAEQQQQAQQHEADMQEREHAHQQSMAEHDAMTQQTAIGQIQAKDQADANKHARGIEKMQLQRAMPPVNGAMATMEGLS